ncbi:MAG: hypothetical protein J6Y60_03780 [Treponema sp.]|nr:hypothetical protein [Treponema sp.]
MSKESSIYMAGFFVLGFIAFGIMAYMYDFVKKNGIPEEDDDDDADLFSGNRKLFSLYLAPFRYLYLNFKNKKYFAVIPFIIMIVLFVNAMILGHYMLIKQ